MLKILLINPHKILDLCGSGVYYMRCHSGIAQSVEQWTVNPCVVGSSPTAGARISADSADFLYQKIRQFVPVYRGFENQKIMSFFMVKIGVKKSGVKIPCFRVQKHVCKIPLYDNV